MLLFCAGFSPLPHRKYGLKPAQNSKINLNLRGNKKVMKKIVIVVALCTIAVFHKPVTAFVTNVQANVLMAFVK